MDADDIAIAIAVMLDAHKVKFKFHASGVIINEKMLFDNIVIEAYHPRDRDFVRMATLEEANRFLKTL